MFRSRVAVSLVACVAAGMLVLAGCGGDDIIENAVPVFTPAKGPQTYADVAGTTMIPAGDTSYLDVDLEPGRYALLCFLPDQANPTTDHLHNGMATTFTVS